MSTDTETTLLPGLASDSPPTRCMHLRLRLRGCSASLSTPAASEPETDCLDGFQWASRPRTRARSRDRALPNQVCRFTGLGRIVHL